MLVLQLELHTPQVLYYTAPVVDAHVNALVETLPGPGVNVTASRLSYLDLRFNYYSSGSPFAGRMTGDGVVNATFLLAYNCLRDDFEWAVAHTCAARGYHCQAIQYLANSVVCSSRNYSLPLAPGEVVAVGGVNSVNVTWVAGLPSYPPVASFNVTVYAPGNVVAASMVVSADLRSVVVSPLLSGTSYQVTVSAVASGGYSSAATATVQDATPCSSAGSVAPFAPRMYDPVLGRGYMTFSWPSAPASPCWSGSVDAWNVTVLWSDGSYIARNVSTVSGDARRWVCLEACVKGCSGAHTGGCHLER